VLWALSIYFVPLLIALMSVAALLMWDDQYAVNGSGRPLELKCSARRTRR
jgi:hypothetical protein